MRNAKKITAIAVIAAMLLSFMSFGVFADGQWTATLERVDDKVIRPGDSFDVNVKVNGGSGESDISALVLLVNISQSIFESATMSANFKPVAGKTYTTSAGDAGYGADANIFEMGIDSIANTLSVSNATPVMVLTLKVKSDTTATSSTLSFESAEGMNATTYEKITITGSDLVIPIKQPVTIETVGTLDDVTVPYGTPKETALPKTVNVNGNVPVELDWSDVTYDETVGVHNYTSKFKEDKDVNTNGKTAPSVKVTVEKAAAAPKAVNVEVAVDGGDAKIEGAALVTGTKLNTTDITLTAANNVSETIKGSDVTWTTDGKELDVTSSEDQTVTITGTIAADKTTKINPEGVTVTAVLTYTAWTPVKDAEEFAAAYKALTYKSMADVTSAVAAEDVAAILAAKDVYDATSATGKADIEKGLKKENLDAFLALVNAVSGTMDFGSSNRVNKALQVEVKLPEDATEPNVTVTLAGNPYNVAKQDNANVWAGENKFETQGEALVATLTYKVDGKTVTVVLNGEVRAKAVSSGGGTNWNDLPNIGGTTNPSNPTDPTDPSNPTDPTDPSNPSNPEDGFIDMGGFDWASEAVNALAKEGIINGVGGNMFDPNGNITREEFAKIVVGVFGITGSADVTFEDVDASEWYAPYIAAAVEAGLITGESATYFGVGQNITREDMATILGRALDRTATAGLNFTDAADVADYAANAVALLSELGIINGYEDGSFGPKATATRAEAAKMMYGVKQLIAVDDNADDNADDKTE